MFTYSLTLPTSIVCTVNLSVRPRSNLFRVLPDSCRNMIFSVWPLSPNNCSVTFASVPAYGISPVLNVKLYAASAKKNKDRD